MRTAPSRARREHPVLIDRFLDDAVRARRGRALRRERRPGSAASSSTSRRPASTRATRSRCCRPGRSRRRCWTRSATRRAGSPRASRCGASSTSSSRSSTASSTSSRSTRAPRAPCPSSRRRSAFRWRARRRCWRPGRPLASLGLPPERDPVDFFIKAPVFPFRKFPGEDVLLGPEMKSTGEVMGISPRFGDAFAKACEAVGTRLPLSGRAFLTVNPYDKAAVIPIGRELADLGFALCATRGHARGAAGGGRRRGARLQGQRGQPQRGRPDGGGGDPARHQHAPRRRVALRRGRDPGGGPAPVDPVPDDAVGRHGRRRGNPLAPGGGDRGRPLQEYHRG